MSRKSNLLDQQLRAKLHGGKCLSTEYMNSSTKMTWQCSRGHIWETKPNKIQQGQWCPYCVGKHPHTLKDMQVFAEKKGGECLSTEYKRLDRKLRWKCAKGHTWIAKATNVFSIGQWCPYCSGNARLTLEEMQKIAKNKDGKCLSTVYKNKDSNLIWQCKKGHTWKALANNVRRRGDWCPKCSGRTLMSIAEVKQLARDRGGRCLSKNVKRNSQSLNWQCGKGHKWQASFSNVKNKKSWCPYCNVYKKEAECREIFEKLFSFSFPRKTRFLDNRLELDGYCEKLSLAFEYNGKQHYKRIPYWHRTPNAFPDQQKRDKEKKFLCQQKGINLVVIPYTCTKLEEYIEKRCQKLGYLV